VMLTTALQWRDYICMKDGWVAKFMPRFDRLYEITQVFPESSLYKLLLPPPSKAYSMFHVAQLEPHIPNNDDLFPGHANVPPKPLVAIDGTTEYFINKILD